MLEKQKTAVRNLLEKGLESGDIKTTADFKRFAETWEFQNDPFYKKKLYTHTLELKKQQKKLSQSTSGAARKAFLQKNNRKKNIVFVPHYERPNTRSRGKIITSKNDQTTDSRKTPKKKTLLSAKTTKTVSKKPTQKSRGNKAGGPQPSTSRHDEHDTSQPSMSAYNEPSTSRNDSSNIQTSNKRKRKRKSSSESDNELLEDSEEETALLDDVDLDVLRKVVRTKNLDSLPRSKLVAYIKTLSQKETGQKKSAYETPVSVTQNSQSIKIALPNGRVEEIYTHPQQIEKNKKTKRRSRYTMAGFKDVAEYRNSFSIEKVKVQTFGTLAKNHVYNVKFNNFWDGKKVEDVMRNLEQVFDDVIVDTRGNLKGTDAGRILINHSSLHTEIVVPLTDLNKLDGKTVLNRIENVLNSQKSLAIDNSFTVSVGMVEFPKGNGRRIYPTDKNSMYRKNAVTQILNDDNLCLARAIAVSWAKQNKITQKEWNLLVAPDITALAPGQKIDTVKCIMKYGKVGENFHNELYRKSRKNKDGKVYMCSGSSQERLALAIAEKANVSLTEPGSIADIPKYEQALNTNICVLSMQANLRFITPAITGLTKIFILHDKDHFDSIVNIDSFFTNCKFCITCMQPYSHPKTHVCESCCPACHRKDCIENYKFTCDICNQTVRSKVCYEKHRKLTNCYQNYKCPSCKKLVSIKDRTKQDHICGEIKCRMCDKYVQKGHKCYTRSHKIVKRPLRLIHFDFECRQDDIYQCNAGYKPAENNDTCKACTLISMSKCVTCSRCQNCNDPVCGQTVHKPNLAIAHTSCDKCKDEEVFKDSKCDQCGYRCSKCDDMHLETLTFVKPPCNLDTCGFRRAEFYGDNTGENFCKWLFSRSHYGYTAMAHNNKGYDGYFLLNYLIANNIRPNVNYAGSKIMSLKVLRGLNIKVIDSLNFLQMALSKLPKTFGFKGLKKGFFPHLFNILTNQDYVGKYPDPYYYGVDQMSSEARELFFKWYETVQNEIFDFKKELFEYCDDDVTILRKATLAFLKIIMEITGTKVVDPETGHVSYEDYIDPFQVTTIAGVCMKIMRSIFFEETWHGTKKSEPDVILELIKKKGVFYHRGVEIKKKEWNYDKFVFVKSDIAFLPSETYYDKDQYSIKSLQWLASIEEEKGIKIQHALQGGEKEIVIGRSRYKIDGYHEDPLTGERTCYEYHGCKPHACVRCFPVGRSCTVDEYTNTLETRYELTKLKETRLEQEGYRVVTMWNCDFDTLLRENAGLKNFVTDLEEKDYFVPKLDPRESLFGGRTNASRLHYKVKKGEKIEYYDFTSLYPWTNKTCPYPKGHPEIITSNFDTLENYFGIAKVRVLPPDNLYHPVLPFKSNGKLKFPLCKTCAELENKEPCQCSDKDRAFVGTWWTPEINLAVKKGYKILKIFEVYHWDDVACYDADTKSGGLFTEYVDTFLKIKQTASGFPVEADTNEKKEKYVADYFENEGIQLDKEEIGFNPGLRAVAKILLNSLWGKFAQRDNLQKTKYFHESEMDEFLKMLRDPTKRVTNFYIVTDELLLVEYEDTEGFIKENVDSNIFVGSITTAWARVKLYSVLDVLGERVLYYDTDSVVFVTRPGDKKLKTGNYLGQLTNEISEEQGGYIIEFVSGGPKNYAYITKNGHQVCKVRGFSLNFKNKQIVNFEAMKDMVLNDMDSEKVVTNNSKICRSKALYQIYNREEKKRYKIVYTKRIILSNYNTVPYGTKDIKQYL